jgi:hypothetical protein
MLDEGEINDVRSSIFVFGVIAGDSADINAIQRPLRIDVLGQLNRPAIESQRSLGSHGTFDAQARNAGSRTASYQGPSVV